MQINIIIFKIINNKKIVKKCDKLIYTKDFRSFSRLHLIDAKSVRKSVGNFKNIESIISVRINKKLYINKVF